jgi:hypothetical protein
MEEWKDIPGYEGLYQASSEGQVRSHPNKKTFTELRGVRSWKTRILKSRGDSYITGKRASLWKDGKCKDWLQARLVALAWIPGYEDGMTVNHINGNRMDNRPANLEWLTLGDNIRHGYATGLYSNTQKAVALRDERSGKVKFFPSMAEASRFLGKNDKYLSCRISRGELRIGNIEIIRNA